MFNAEEKRKEEKNFDVIGLSRFYAEKQIDR